MFGFSLVRDLAGFHARRRIFMRHYNTWCLVLRAWEADTALRMVLGRRKCKIPYADFPEFAFHALGCIQKPGPDL